MWHLTDDRFVEQLEQLVPDAAYELRKRYETWADKDRVIEELEGRVRDLITANEYLVAEIDGLEKQVEDLRLDISVYRKRETAIDRAINSNAPDAKRINQIAVILGDDNA